MNISCDFVVNAFLIHEMENLILLSLFGVYFVVGVEERSFYTPQEEQTLELCSREYNTYISKFHFETCISSKLSIISNISLIFFELLQILNFTKFRQIFPELFQPCLNFPCRGYLLHIFPNCKQIFSKLPQDFLKYDVI